MKNILFTSPYMGRTGSEIMLLNIINNVKNFNPILYSGHNGSLLKNVNSNIKIYVNPLEKRHSYYCDFILKKTGFNSLIDRQLKKINLKNKIDFWILNTLDVSKLIPTIKKFNIPFAVHIHELHSSYDLLKGEDLDFVLKNAKFFIGCSKLVCRQIESVSNKKAFLFLEGIVTNNIKINTEFVKQKALFFKHYNKVFIMSGACIHRKGFSLLPEISRFLKTKNCALIWIGKGSDYGLERFIKIQLSNEGLSNIYFTGELKNDYYEWLSIGDAFLLTSLEDPYPLVMIEAAFMQKPIIAFDSGGSKEFIQEGMGRVVPIMNMNELYNAINDFLENKMEVNSDKLYEEAVKHDIINRISEYEKIIEEGMQL